MIRRGQSLPPGVIAAAAAIGALLAVWAVSASQDASSHRAPALVGKTIDGKAFSLPDLKGKMVLLNFWATWCGPCQSEIPDLKALQQKYGPRGFTVVSVAVQDELPAVQKRVREQGMDWPQLMLEKDWVPLVRDQVSGLPTSLLIDRNGRVVFEFTGVDPSDSPLAKFGREIEKRL